MAWVLVIRHSRQSELKKKLFRNVPANTVSSKKKKKLVDAGRARSIAHALRDPNLKIDRKLHT